MQCVRVPKMPISRAHTIALTCAGMRYITHLVSLSSTSILSSFSQAIRFRLQLLASMHTGAERREQRLSAAQRCVPARRLDGESPQSRGRARPRIVVGEIGWPKDFERPKTFAVRRIFAAALRRLAWLRWTPRLRRMGGCHP